MHGRKDVSRFLSILGRWKKDVAQESDVEVTRFVVSGLWRGSAPEEGCPKLRECFEPSRMSQGKVSRLARRTKRCAWTRAVAISICSFRLQVRLQKAFEIQKRAVHKNLGILAQHFLLSFYGTLVLSS